MKITFLNIATDEVEKAMQALIGVKASRRQGLDEDETQARDQAIKALETALGDLKAGG